MPDEPCGKSSCSAIERRCDGCIDWVQLDRGIGGLCAAFGSWPDDWEPTRKHETKFPDERWPYAADRCGCEAIFACGPDFYCKHWEKR